MKKILFFLLLATQIVFAQTNSLQLKTSQSIPRDSSVIRQQDSLLAESLKNIGIGQIQDPFLSSMNLSLNEVSIVATRAGNNTPTTFQTISKEELNKNNLGQDLPFLLDNTPSAVTTSDAGAGVGYTGIRIRGSDNTRVNVTLNGIPVNDAESQNTFFVDLPDLASSAQSIQIQRGVGSSTNGGSAFGATVSMQTQSPSESPFVEANVSGGSFNTFKLNGKIGTGVRKGFFFEGSASWITSDGYIQRASSNLVSY